MSEQIMIAAGNRSLAYLPCGSLRRFGVTPTGGNLYRVVYSTSRLHQLGGKWPDGRIEYRWVPRYPMPAWVLEKWLSAEDWAGPESDWLPDPMTGLYTLGPYPRDGEYEFCFAWPVDMEPSLQQVEDIINYLAYMKRTYKTGDYLAAEQERQAKLQNNWEDRADYVMRDAMRTQAMRPTSSNPQGKTLTANDMKFNITASQLPKHMPREAGKGGVMPTEKQ